MVEVIILLLGCLYMLLIAWFIRGWALLSKFKGGGSSVEPATTPFFSVVIAARNEEHGLVQTLNHLFQQDFPLKGYEVHVVDDHSTDDTWQTLKNFQSQYKHLPLYCHKSQDAQNPTYVAFKKLAIQTGIKYAKGQWIVTTDADCQHPKTWLKCFYQFIQKQDPVLVSGPVAFWDAKGLLGKLQILEFMALIGIGAATVRQHVPSMCNGANLVYRKQAFWDVNGFQDVDGLASGDDEFLMHKLHSRYPNKVYFLKSTAAMVHTKPQSTLKGLWQQRMRWASKGPYYESVFLKVVTGFVGFYHLILLLLLVLPWNGGFLLTVIAFGLKMVPESLFLVQLTTFFKQQSASLLLYFPAAFIYPFYVVGIGIASQVGGFRWKGRKVH